MTQTPGAFTEFNPVDFSGEYGYVLTVEPVNGVFLLVEFVPRFSALTRLLLIPIVIAVPVLFHGCSAGEYIGAYFNTYYNAQRDFDGAETELLNQQDPKKADRAYLPTYTVPANAKTKFGSVIEKCSKILQYHSESSLVDDAILMIGKAYYYQNDLQQAERKFRELTAQFPDGDLFLEGKLLLANTLYRSNSTRDAQALGNELLDIATQKGDDRIAYHTAVLLAAIELDAKNLTPARERYQSAADHAPANKDRFNALMKVAELSTTFEEFEQAEKAYREASDASTTYLEDYQAKIGLARTQSKLGLYQESLDLMDDLLGNNNYREHFGEIELEVGNVYRDMDDLDAAVEQYRYVDTTYARSETSAKSYYELGLIYEKKMFQYDSARVAFGKGKTEAPQAVVTPLLAARSEYMDRHAVLRAELTKNDSLKQLILFPPVQADTHSVSVNMDRKDSLLAGTPGDAGNQFRDDTSFVVATDSLGRAPTGLVMTGHDSTAVAQIRQIPIPADSVRNPSAVDSSLTVAGDNLGLVVTDSTLGAHDSTGVVKFQPVTIPIDTVNARLAHTKSELASLFYLSLDVPDSAQYWYERLLVDHPESSVEPQALYSLAQLHARDSLDDRMSTDSLYRVLIAKHPGSEFAAAARRALGIPPPEIEVDVAAQEYLEAEKLRNEGNYRRAITSLKSIVKKYPESTTASKALFALGWMYENVTPNPDSALSNYAQVVSLFPGTEYARVAQTKIDAVEQHKRGEQEQVTADSLSNIEQQLENPENQAVPSKTDSTNSQEQGGVMKEEEVILREDSVSNPDSLKKPDP